MKNSILFKNGELEITKSLVEVMQDSRKNHSRKAIIPVANYNKGIFTLKSLDCNFHFLNDCIEYARLLECAYFTGAIKVMNSDVDSMERKDIETGLDAEQKSKLYEIYDTIEIFNDIIVNCYTKEEIAFSNADKMIKFMSVYFSKDISCFATFPHFIEFLNNLSEDKPTQVLKPILEKVLNSFSIEKDDAIYKTYRFHANTTLVEDCKHRYYKGRKVSKGKVVKSYDTDGKAVKTEIVLGVIEDLQRKSRKAYESEEKAFQEQEEKKKKAQEKAKQVKDNDKESK